jgi:hypothetical protein
MDISPALSYTQRVLAGDFMNNNPYLDTAFSNAAGNVRRAMDTQFAKSGRFLSDAHANASGNAYNQLANDIYGGAYQQERGFMNQAAAMLPGLYGQNLNNMQGLLGMGQMQDEMQREKTNWTQYDAARRLSMMQPGASMISPPMQQNRAAGALGGALTGMSLMSGLLGG